MLIVLGFGDANGLFKVLIGQGWISDFVAVLFQERRFAASNDAGPTVEEKKFHRDRTYATKKRYPVWFSMTDMFGKVSQS